MDAYETIVAATQGPIATITLNRPETRNAMSARMVEELLGCFTALHDDPAHAAVRVVVVRAAGSGFCSGSDLRDLVNQLAAEESRAALTRLDALLRTVQTLRQVVIMRVQGAAMGGGLGLVCAADIAIAGYSASFGLPEVRLGLVPAIIAPYLVARLGMPCARYLMLTGTRFGGEAALRYGLVHEFCPDNELDARVALVINNVLHGGPVALSETKRLLSQLALTPDTLDSRVHLLDRLRVSEEAQQGMAAFLHKRPAPWAPEA